MLNPGQKLNKEFSSRAHFLRQRRGEIGATDVPELETKISFSSLLSPRLGSPSSALTEANDTVQRLMVEALSLNAIERIYGTGNR